MFQGYEVPVPLKELLSMLMHTTSIIPDLTWYPHMRKVVTDVLDREQGQVFAYWNNHLKDIEGRQQTIGKDKFGRYYDACLMVDMLHHYGDHRFDSWSVYMLHMLKKPYYNR